MKRYLLFVAAVFYPSGGWEDFKGSFDSIEEALTAGRKAVSGDWDLHVIDTQTWTKVAEETYDWPPPSPAELIDQVMRANRPNYVPGDVE